MPFTRTVEHVLTAVDYRRELELATLGSTVTQQGLRCPVARTTVRESQRDTRHVDLFAKLQLKPGQRLVSVLTPDAFVSHAPEATDGESPQESALIVFVADRETLESHREQIAGSAREDRLTWVSYPKSGQLDTDLNRDSLAALLAESGIQPVRQIAIDDVWSALRFRPR